MLVLQINSKIDCAGVSYNLCQALNKYTDIDCRHVVAVEHPFKYQYDMGPENYDEEEFYEVIREADILHFNHIDYFTPSFGMDWEKFIGRKKIVYHSHAGWEEGKEYFELYKIGGLWGRYVDADAVLVCNPNNVGIFKNAQWIPNVMPKIEIDVKRDFNGTLKVAHCPSHTKYKNVNEMRQIMQYLENVEYNHIKIPERNRFFEMMAKNHILFDNVWQGYFGLVSLEAMQLGIVPMARVSQLSYEGYCEKLGCDDIPIEFLSDISDIITVVKKYDENRELLKQKSEEVKKWIDTYYNEKIIVKMWEEFYNGLIQVG